MTELRTWKRAKIKSPVWACVLSALTALAGGCSDKSKSDEHPCKTGAEACQCYANDTCDRGLTCFAKLCLDLDAGLGGDGPQLGGAGEGSLGEEAGSPGSAGDGPASGGSLSSGGSIGSGGKLNTGGGGTSSGGSISGGGSGGSGGGADPFPPDPAGCALVTSCPTCCETTGVFALDTADLDATARYVTAFEVTASNATAEFEFESSDEVGAIFFRFGSPQDIGALSIAGLATGGSMEIALVRASGKDGCIYPVQGGSLSSTPSTCWGLGAGPYAALPADQIEIRVRSTSSGRAALNVSSVEYAP